MPGLKNRGKGKARQNSQKTSFGESPTCQTLDEDGITRCIKPATHGTPPRCESHHKEYCTLTKAYKDASKIVDDILDSNTLPTLSEIALYKDYRLALEKTRWLERYLEALRTERKGREMHHTRFFVKMDDGHRIRLNVLAKAMRSTIELLIETQQRTFHLYKEEYPESDLSEEPFPSYEGAWNSTAREAGEMPMDTEDSWGYLDRAEHMELENADLIDMETRAQKGLLLGLFKPLYDRNFWQKFGFYKDKDREADFKHYAELQYARRIVFYDPVLYIKALDKVSFEDLFLDPEFSTEDVNRFFGLFEKLGFSLLWWKDSVREALQMTRGGRNRAANVGDLGDRIAILGGWIYNTRHKKSLSDEEWGHLLMSLNPIPDNVENRFVRLCNNFNDLETFLSFVAFGMLVSTPTRFLDENQELDCRVSRNTLSISGIAVADMVASRSLPISHPSVRPASRPGFRTWVEFESRSFIFGAVRSEPHAPTDAWIKELRARPDLFHVQIVHSETGAAETFGGAGKPSKQWRLRARTFEAPAEVCRPVNTGNKGEWKVEFSARDILYGTGPLMGELTRLQRGGEDAQGSFFRFRQFPVRYFVVMDVKPHRHPFYVFRAAAWAALRAQGMADGMYSELKYARASDTLYQRVVRKRLSWSPPGWTANTYEEELRARGQGRPDPLEDPNLEHAEVIVKRSENSKSWRSSWVISLLILLSALLFYVVKGS